MNKLIEAWFENQGYDYDYIKKIDDSRHDNLKDIDRLCEELKIIHDNNSLIVVLPDYDMDGIMSGVVGYAGLSELGFNVGLYRPDVTEGYGFSSETVKKIMKQFPCVSAIITCDTGITCYEGSSYAMQEGLKVLITDHHTQESGKTLLADVIVDPNRVDETYKNKGICGAHVLWQVLNHYAKSYCDSFKIEQINRLRVFAGIGTISDIMPLVYENRDLVRDCVGICQLVWDDGNRFFINSLTGCNPYVRAFNGLYIVLNCFYNEGKISNINDITEIFMGFYVAPTFNSVKRMNGSMDVAFGVFFGFEQEEDMKKLIILNEERKEAVNNYYVEMMESHQEFAPYIYISDAPAGILGLLATKVQGIIGETVMVVRQNGNGYNGSGRSPHWYPALDMLSKEGFHIAGHQGAFGISVTDKRELKNLWAFLKDSINTVKATVEIQEVNPDIIIATDYAGTCGIDIPLFFSFLREIRKYAPFGKDFEMPIIAFDFKPTDARWMTMGSTKQHLKGEFEKGFTLIIWNGADKLNKIKGHNKVRCLGNLNVNEYCDSKSIQFVANEVVL